LQRGVATLRGEAMMLSGVHTAEDVEHTIRAWDQSVAALLEEGTLQS
jgi:hypothetical protein